MSTGRSPRGCSSGSRMFSPKPSMPAESSRSSLENLRWSRKRVQGLRRILRLLSYIAVPCCCGQQVPEGLEDVPSVAANLYTVNAANMNTFLSHYPTGFMVKFMVPWSVQCLRWAPVFREAASKINDHPHVRELNYTIPFVEIDMTESSNLPLASKFGISGFPTFLFFERHLRDRGDIHGWEHKSGQDSVDFGEVSTEEFEGNMDAQELIDFVETVSGPALQESPPGPDEKFALTLFSKAARKSFLSVAKRNRRTAHWHHQTVKENKSWIELKHKGEVPIRLDLGENDGGKDEEQMIKKFLKENDKPEFGVLDRSSFSEYSGHSLVWILPQMESEGDLAARKDEWRGVVSSLMSQKKEHGFKVAITSTVSFRSHLQGMFGISEFPRVVAQKRAGHSEYWIWSGSVEELHKTGNAAPLVTWLQQIKKGDIARTFKSEPIPDYEVEPGEPKMVVAATMTKELFRPERDTFLNVYAPWCGHCKNFAPEFRKVARKIHLLNMEDKIFVATLDGTANESVDSRLSWEAYPTIVFIKAGTSEVQQYEGPRDAATVYKWLSTQSTHSGKMDKEMGDVKMDL